MDCFVNAAFEADPLIAPEQANLIIGSISGFGLEPHKERDGSGIGDGLP